MSDYLQNLVARSLNRADCVRPRTPALFEPSQPALLHSVREALAGVRAVVSVEDRAQPFAASNAGQQEQQRKDETAATSSHTQDETVGTKPLTPYAPNIKVESLGTNETPPVSERGPAVPASQKTAPERQRVAQPPSLPPAQASNQTPAAPARTALPRPADFSSPNRPEDFSSPKERRGGAPPAESERKRKDRRTPATGAESENPLRRPMPDAQATESPSSSPRANESEPAPAQLTTRERTRRSVERVVVPDVADPVVTREVERGIDTRPQTRLIEPQITMRSVQSATPPQFVEPAQAESTDEAHTIHITIGRIEVRATAATEAALKSSRGKERKPPSLMSLDDYLRRRAGGGQR